MKPMQNVTHVGFPLRLSALSDAPPRALPRYFHVKRRAREEFSFESSIFSLHGDVIFASPADAHRFAATFNQRLGKAADEGLRPAEVNAMGLVHEVLHAVVDLYRRQGCEDALALVLRRLESALGKDLDATLLAFVDAFPPPDVFQGKLSPAAYLQGSTEGEPHRQSVLEELLLLWVCNQNPAYKPIQALVSDSDLAATSAYGQVVQQASDLFGALAPFGPDGQSLLDLLQAPARHAPHSIEGQLEFMRTRWGLLLGDGDLWRRLLLGVDVLREEGRWFLRKSHGVGAEDSLVPRTYRGPDYDAEPEAFSADHEWMPRVVMMAKSTFVWLAQLSKSYGRAITTLRDVPDEELETLAQRGFTALWLIGVWRRSSASRRIKQLHGAYDAVASAYSLADYEIAEDLGGWEAYHDLRKRAARCGIRLASDMVPNHMGIDSAWVRQHPDWFVQTREPPFPNYTFHGVDLSEDPSIGIYLEDGYWTKTDAAVVFKRVDRATGDTRYLYHGNDGTSMPWNDTAQLDYLKAEVREAVIQTILHVARCFPIIRFDAAMTLAKRHYQRLWYPQPGSGGDIPSRARFARTKEEFDEVFPVEFWREVVDRVARECPDTLLLAEAFWMMEGYFVRTLGMHRVYNSAFMNMLKKEENGNFRVSIRHVLEFNPQILKRHVNFMNNPDEETALAQFGKDDKYFGVATLLATMPGLPMFGHGQVEGFAEKYGMEYRAPKRDEHPDPWLVGRHEREIFPLLRKRYLFAEVDQFLLYDLYTPHGAVDEDVIAYSNRAGHERSLVVVHNKFKDTRGHLRMSAGFLNKGGAIVQRSLSDGLALPVDGPGGKDYFVVFRDAITGLEYLRETRDLAEKGLYVELGAFKYHVFWEFRDVESTAQTPYRALAEELAGRGVPSIDDALIDWIHRSVHTSFYEAIRPESIDYLARGWDAEEDAPSKECEGALHEKLRHVLEGIAYAHGSQGDMLPVHADLETRYDNLMRWSTWAATANHPLSAGGTHVLLAWAFTGALEHIRGRMGQAHGKQRAWHGWALARVVERAFRARGVEEATARRWTTLLEFFALEPWTWTPHAPLSLRQLTLALISSPSARIVVGANTFEGVTYVSKDLLEEALLFGEGYLAMEQAADEGSETSSETLLEAYEKLHQERGALLKSAEAVGFVLDAFRTRLAPPVSRPQTAAVPAPPAHG